MADSVTSHGGRNGGSNMTARDQLLNGAELKLHFYLKKTPHNHKYWILFHHKGRTNGQKMMKEENGGISGKKGSIKGLEIGKEKPGIFLLLEKVSLAFILSWFSRESRFCTQFFHCYHLCRMVKILGRRALRQWVHKEFQIILVFCIVNGLV